MRFKSGFEKTAVIGSLMRIGARGLMAPAKAVGRAAIGSPGKALNTGFNILSFTGDTKGFYNKLEQAGQR